MIKRYAQILKSEIELTATDGIVTNIVNADENDLPLFPNMIYIEIAPDANITVGMRYENGQFITPPAPELPPPAPQTITLFDFYQLFNASSDGLSALGRIKNSIVPEVVALVTILDTYQNLEKGNLHINNGLDLLATLGIITTEQAEKLKNFEPL